MNEPMQMREVRNTGQTMRNGKLNTVDDGNNGAVIMIYARCAGDLAYKDGRKYVTKCPRSGVGVEGEERR